MYAAEEEVSGFFLQPDIVTRGFSVLPPLSDPDADTDSPPEGAAANTARPPLFPKTANSTIKTAIHFFIGSSPYDSGLALGKCQKCSSGPGIFCRFHRCFLHICGHGRVPAKALRLFVLIDDPQCHRVPFDLNIILLYLLYRFIRKT